MSDMNRLLVQIKHALKAFLHSRPFETRRDVLSGFRVYSNILMSERSTLTDFAIRSAKNLMVEPSATVGQGLHSAAIHDVPSVPYSLGSVVHALLMGLAHHIASLRTQELQHLSIES